MEGSLGYMLLLQVVLIALNAVFACAEIAVISISDGKLAKLAADGDKRAKRLVKLTSKPEKFLATIQVAITLSGFLGSAFAAENFSDVLVDWVVGLGVGVPRATLEAVSIVLITLILSYFTLVFGELVPKRVAMRKAEQLGLAVSGMINGISIAFKPIVWFLSVSTNAVLRLLGIDPNEHEEEASEEEIRMMVDVGEEKGVIEGSQKDMINNIFEFDDITAEEIMTPRVDVTALDAEDPLEQALELGVDSGYSRLPVYEEDIDHTIGVLYMKDLLPYVGKLMPDVLKLRDFVRPTLFVPGTKRGGALFAEMTEKHIQLACVVDEYGGFAGVVTIEDLLESIVGNMQDEFDHEEEEITRLDDNSFDVDGSCSIEELSEQLHILLPEGDYDTVAGFILDQLGRIPEENEQPTVTYDRVTLTVLSMDDRAIDRVHVLVAPPAPDETAEKEE